MIDISLKQTVLREYLVDETSYRKTEKKYGVHRMTLGRWMVAEKYAIKQAAISQTMNPEEKAAADQASLSVFASQIQQLQKQFSEEKLSAQLLTAMIDVAEQELKLPIRKKYGTRQFKNRANEKKASLSQLCSLLGYS